MEDDGGGGGGWDFNAFKAMINADNPELLARYAVEHYKLARELHDVVYDLDRSLGQLDDVFSSQHAAPALKARLLQSIGEMDNVGTRIEGNSRLLDQAAQALHRAREAVNGIKEDDPDASPRAEAVRNQLSFEYGTITPQLDTFDSGIEPDVTPYRTSKEISGYAPGGSGPERTGGGGTFVPATSPSGRPSTAGSFRRGPILGGPTGPGGKLSRGTGAASPMADGHGRTDTGTGRATSADGRTRVGPPGARSGAPIGGYRPVAGTSGTGSATTPAGASTPGKPGTPGGPGRPGMVPPGGTGPGQPGKDRPGRRLTNYEKLEPNVFLDDRHRVKPVIGEQRRQPDDFGPTPGAIGGRQTAEQKPVLPELPTRETPTRFEGHDVSVSFNRRSRGSQ